MGKYQTTLDASPLNKVDLTARVGSIKISQINFPKNENFFFPDEQVPASIRDFSKQVKQSINPDTLGLRKPEWSKQTIILEEHKRATPNLRQHL